ncbi:uncharacterized protein LOC131016850 isoform X2 [Salvia miltiorrhiza]|uniref:uncharacterized protein LOC131016850 isoform X2 n=1 Tax=Salvia miltiorrhiza TaxID=226208 RepID=UPI0025AD0D03|nr:uncharacterized protein LOC131016850 isoform X2 [Salvia miltiorrhiza]
MAYEAFDTLLQTLDRILKHGDDRVITHSIKQEILSIRVQAVVLQLDVKHYPNKERIREAAVSTHEIIEYLFSEENVSDGVRLVNRLREVAQRLESTVGDVVDYIKGKGPVASLTDSPDVRSTIRSSKDDEVVGFQEDLVAIRDQLRYIPSRLMVFPIVGTGGIELPNVDDDDLADMDDDYMPDAEDTRHNENTGWSSRTRNIFRNAGAQLLSLSL